jgi:feruloyl esterase
MTVSIFTACAGSNNQKAKHQIADCGSLQGFAIPASAIGLPTSGALVKTATLIAMNASGNVNGEYCKVVGIIKPVSPNTPDMEFEVNLPATWNKRAVQMGGGGYDGSLVDGLASEPLAPANTETPLKRGYVTLGGDGGHKASWAFDGRWGMNDEALLNYGKQSVEKDQAPGRIIAIDANQNANRSRPLCEWPS